MKKDKKWLREEVYKLIEGYTSFGGHEHTFITGENVNKLGVLIDQLDETELPVIPQFVADYIEIAKQDIPLLRVFDIANNVSEMDKWKKEYEWIRRNSDLFARAWLDGYEVEKEPRYYVAFEGEFNLLYVTHVDIYGENGKVNYNSESDTNRAMKFTDKSRAKYLADFLGAIVVEVTE